MGVIFDPREEALLKDEWERNARIIREAGQLPYSIIHPLKTIKFLKSHDKEER